MSNIRSAMTLLPEIRKGAAITELSTALQEAAEAALEFGKPATVTLTIVVYPDKNDKRRLTEPPLLLTAEVDRKFPKAPLEATLFFRDSDHQLTRNLEREPELPLSTIGGARDQAQGGD